MAPGKQLLLLLLSTQTRLVTGMYTARFWQQRKILQVHSFLNITRARLNQHGKTHTALQQQAIGDAQKSCKAEKQLNEKIRMAKFIKYEQAPIASK